MKKGEKCPLVLYTVYNNKDDMPVIVDGTAIQAAKAMGISPKSFYSIATKVKKGKNKKWHFEKITRQEWEKEFEME